MILALLLAAAAPDWVATQGRSLRFPLDRYLTAYAAGATVDAARTQASADVARAISVRIESELSDRMEIKDGSEKQQISALSKASSDVRLTGLTIETFSEGAQHHAFAVLERAPAAVEERSQRDAAVATLHAALKAATGDDEAQALKAALSARTAIAEALKHEGLARAIARSAADPKFDQDLAESSQAVEARVAALLKRPQTTLREAAESLAFQLGRQGVGKGAKWAIAPFTFKTTVYPSLFGRAVASELERALAASASASGTADLAFRGTYTEDGDAVRLLVVAREVQAGRTVASAEATVPRKAIPQDLPLTPPNLMQALRDQKVLAAGEEVPGGLSLALFTNKHDAGSSQVYLAKEELKLFVRVNKPSYVRLVYLLQSGAKVPLTQAWFINEDNVNKLVEFPDAFEIAPPYGSEHIQAAAFTVKPEPLPTTKATFDGVEYDVVAEGTGSLVKHRGFTKKTAANETADAFVTITTMPQ